MDSNTQYFFVLLRSFLKEATPPKAIEVEWENIYKLARIHAVSGAVYVAIQKLNKEAQPKDDILKKFKNDFIATFIRYHEQKKGCDEITVKLEEEKIQHIFLKGSVVKEYYPVKAMRTLGDIDLLIHKDDQEAAKKVLVKIGYNNLSCLPSGRPWEYEKNNLRVEVHYKLIYSGEINNKADYGAYFGKVWENANPRDKGYRYELSLEFNLIYLITHMAKHFCYSGCGVRMFLDIAVIMIKFNEKINFYYLWRELKKIKLDIFAKNIFAICKKYFDIDISKTEQDENFEIEDKNYDIISSYIIEGGAFGNKSFYNYIIRQEYEKKASMKLAQTKLLFRVVFLEYKEMKKSFPVLENFPFLLPFFWVVRGFLCILTRRKSTVGILKELTAEHSEAEESYEVIKKIGL
jgi:hypothetical protein